MGDRAAFIITTKEGVRSNETLDSFLDYQSSGHYWVSPFVVIGSVKQNHPDFHDTFVFFESKLNPGETLTILDEDGTTLYSNCREWINMDTVVIGSAATDPVGRNPIPLLKPMLSALDDLPEGEWTYDYEYERIDCRELSWTVSPCFEDINAGTALCTIINSLRDLQTNRGLKQFMKECASSLSPTMPHVLDFAFRMEKKLALNRHKGNRESWVNESTQFLLSRIVSELGEATERLCNDHGAEDVANELADVGNFCMMLADKLKVTSQKPPPVPNSFGSDMDALSQGDL